jgi:hypothetical protein
MGLRTDADWLALAMAMPIARDAAGYADALRWGLATCVTFSLVGLVGLVIVARWRAAKSS